MWKISNQIQKFDFELNTAMKHSVTYNTYNNILIYCFVVDDDVFNSVTNSIK